jgi:DNA modification methylase
MEIVKGRYGECRFCDNMDPEFGLPSLEEKSWDLCLTDPPYNVNFTSKSQQKRYWTNLENRSLPEKQEYKDMIEDYDAFCISFYENIIRVSNRLIFSPGIKYFGWWLQHYPPKDWGIHYKRNGKGCSHIFQFTKKEPYLFYGKFKSFQFLGDVWDFYIMNGFLDKDHFEHPSPKPLDLWLYFITSIQPISVIDPFLGSGTTAEVCESLKIPWLGYEIMEAYKPDIEKRIKRGIEKSKQTNLEAFFT